MCLHPQYIQRKNAVDLFRQGFTTLVFGDKYISLNKDYIRENSEGQEYLAIHIRDCYVRHDNPSDVVYLPEQRDKPSNYYVRYLFPDSFLDGVHLLNSSTGEMIQLYVKCPCGHCVICNSKRVSKTSIRCQLESCTSGIPYFVTLTISPDKYESLLNNAVYEIQCYHKRLRKFLSSIGVQMKYIVVSEIGSRFGRLHFHGLYWLSGNNDSLTELAKINTYGKDSKGKSIVAPSFYEAVFASWQNGHVQVFFAKDLTGSYCFKYLAKQEGNFKLQSKKIGFESINFCRQYIYDNPDKKTFEVLNPYIDKVLEVPIVDFVARYIYPSYCRSVDKELRDNISEFFSLSCQFLNDAWVKFARQMIYDKLEPLVKVGFPIDYNIPREKKPYKFAFSRLAFLFHCILERLSSLDAESVAEQHSKYLIHLHVVEKDLKDKDYTILAKRLLASNIDMNMKENDCQ